MPMARPPLALVLIGVSFVGVTAWLVAASVTPRSVPTFTPDTAFAVRVSGAPDTVTIDARDPDQWQFFSFTAGQVRRTEAAPWDLALRRFRIVTAGEVLRLDTARFDSLRHIPRSGYVATDFGADTVNPAMARWYRYSMFSHLLHPKEAVYVVRTRAGETAKLEFLSYYCPGPSPGCVTFRFAILPQDGG